MLEVWRECYDKLLNEEFMQRRDGLETLAPIEDPCEQFTAEEVRNAIHLEEWQGNWTFGDGVRYVEMLW